MKMKWLTVLLVTVSNISLVLSEKRTPVYRCCPEGESLSNEGKCISVRKEWNPVVVTNRFTKVINSSRDLQEVYSTWQIEYSRPKCGQNQTENLVSPHAPYLLLQNGSLWYDGIIFPPTFFCIDNETAVICGSGGDSTPNFSHEVAPPAEQIRRVYIKKCCYDDLKTADQIKDCVTYGRKKSITVAQFLQNTTSLSVLNISNTFFEYGLPHCDNGDFLIPTGRLSDYNSSLQQDGSLFLPIAKVVLNPKTFCLQHIEGANQHLPTIFTCTNYLPVQVNGTNIAVDGDDPRLPLYALGLFVSAFFLAATLATTWLLPTTHHHMLHWRCQSCHVACLMVGYLLLAITQVAAKQFPKEVCETVGKSVIYLKHVMILRIAFKINQKQELTLARLWICVRLDAIIRHFISIPVTVKLVSQQLPIKVFQFSSTRSPPVRDLMLDCSIPNFPQAKYFLS